MKGCRAIPTHRVAEHPGAFLGEQIEEMGLTAARVAQDTGLAAARLREIVRQRRGVSAGDAIALGAYFGQSPEFWMNAQKTYEALEGVDRERPEHPRAGARPHRGAGGAVAGTGAGRL